MPAQKRESVLLRYAAALGIPQFSTLSLGVAWTLGFAVALAAGALADAFQANAPAFPLMPTASLAVGLNGLCALLSILLGYSVWDAFSIYQPFAGGEVYVLLQGCGWTLLAAASAVMVVYLLQLEPPTFRYGALTILEGFASIGNILLLVSVRYFAPSESRSRSVEGDPRRSMDNPDRGSALEWMLHSPNSETGLVVIFLLSQLFLCNVGALFQSVSSPVMMLFTIFHVLSGIIIHLVIGWKQTEGFKMLRGPIETLYSLLSWLVYVLALAGGIALIRTGTDAPQVTFGMTALAAFIGILSKLVLVRTARAKASQDPVRSTVAKYARFLLSAMATTLACISVGIMYYVRREENFFIGSRNGRALMEGLLFCQTLSVLFLLALSPVTHLIGRVIYGDAFSFFQPFRGSTGFVFLQALGWAFFAACILCMTFHMTATNFRWILYATATGAMGQFFIQFSIEAFASVSSPEAAQAAESGKRREVKPEKESLISGELIVSLLLQLASIILRLVVDISLTQDREFSYVRKQLLISFATLAFVVSVPLAHYSGTSKDIPFFAPFCGSGTYIALQALGWVGYALFLLKSVLEHVLSLNGLVSMHFASDYPFFLWFTMEGCLQLVPLLLVVLSVVTEARFSVSQQRGRRMVTEALECVKAALAEGFEDREANERAALQVSMRILAASALSAHGMQYDRAHFCIGGKPAPERRAATKASEVMKHIDLTVGDEEDVLPLFPTEAETRNGAATLLVMMLCFASASGYVIAALWASKLPLVSFVFSVGGLAVCTISCVGTHCGYGVLLQGHTGEYTFFMLFKGGPVFVALQIAGWVSYACTFILTLIHTLEDEGQTVELLAAALFSVFCQILILVSIPKFDSRPRRLTYLEENGEGVVAVLVFVGAFLFGHLYLRAQEFFRELDAACAVDAGMALSTRRSHVPFSVMALSIVAAVPFVLVTLGRSTKRLVTVAHSPRRDIDAEEDEQWGRRKSLILNVILRISEIVMLMLGMTTPMVFMFLVYHIVKGVQSGIMPLIQYWIPVPLMAVILALLLSLVPHVMSIGVRRQFQSFRECVVVCSVYSIAIISFSIIYGPAFWLPFHSVGVYYTGAVALALSVGAPFRPLRILLRFGVYAMLGYATYVEYLRVLERHTTLSALATLGYYAIDALELLVWLWYLPLYDGKPEETGKYRSLPFVKWAEKYLFRDIGNYFSYRVILEDDSVSMRDGGNQYIFAFHPHGVFAGSALCGIFSEAWAQKIGQNAKTYVSTHEASVVFNVPIIRDFNLSLGALSVTRAAIGASISRGNSPLIVIGGQAELLLTKRSDMVMSVVTYHHGFVRLALRHKVPLVPLISFAEQNVLDIVPAPKLQRATLKLLGFPFPIIPHGRWLLPLPHRTPLTLVVGSPLPIPPGASADNPNDVVTLADAYFAALRTLFYKHRAAAGYPEMELEFHSRKGKKTA
ncbi:putative diacylglycerol acyltransferase [Trypanosoma conorhini]|uniref:Putative diacylglycerol acyltransferase n=1 Tax=Trypanosoma conorhini TaxID=83891 RepID=A0A3R7N5U7_9TRYP|nr:putative diacylglycerol acyltransferase [Trypanosoma conorhini]RNF25886.1 putative diacylglycerol acyltransferase [Trypanosoma conorhini]